MMNIETQGQRHMREEDSPKKPSPMLWSLKVPPQACLHGPIGRWMGRWMNRWMDVWKIGNVALIGRWIEWAGMWVGR